MMQQTYSPKQSEIQKSWVLIDAEGLILGRLASVIATRLRGKHLPTFTPHMDMGDNVIVINAESVALTGHKRADKIFYWHTGHPGGLKGRTMGQMLSGRFPERVIEKAVERMISRGPLGRAQMKNLRVYAGSEHPHEAQMPQVLDVAAMNPKNSVRRAEMASAMPKLRNWASGSIPMGRIESLLMRLENACSETAKAEVLGELAPVLAGISRDVRPKDIAEWRKLRRLPDYLLSVMIENGQSEVVGPAAARALVGCLYPERYVHGAWRDEDVCDDVERALRSRQVECLTTVSCVRDGASARAKIDVRLYGSLPFVLGGRRPRLSGPKWLNANGISLTASGAKVRECYPAQRPGALAACEAVITADPEHVGDEISLFLHSGDIVYDQHDFSRSKLF